MTQLQSMFPKGAGINMTRWRVNTAAGAKFAFGRNVETIYRFDQARTIVSLDSSFLTDEPLSLRYARHFADGRRVRREQMSMNRLYAVESTLTITGSMAEHRVAARPSWISGIAQALLSRIAGGNSPGNVEVAEAKWIEIAAADLRRDAGAGIVIAGEYQPPQVHAAAHAINALLGNAGKTVYQIEPLQSDPEEDLKSLRQLVDDMNNGSASVLLILGCDPAATAPADLGFAHCRSSQSAAEATVAMQT